MNIENILKEKTMKAPTGSNADEPLCRSAGFQTCCAADFQVGSTALQPAGLETRGTADLEVCATLNRYRREIRTNYWVDAAAWAFSTLAIGDTKFDVRAGHRLDDGLTVV
jgi:hypothetical protein